MTEAAFEATANILLRHVTSARPDATAHSRNRLLDIGKPEVEEFQIVA